MLSTGLPPQFSRTLPEGIHFINIRISMLYYSGTLSVLLLPIQSKKIKEPAAMYSRD